MEYYVNIKIENSFEGTGFFGKKFSSYEEFLEIANSYLKKSKGEIMQFSFHTGSIIDNIKTKGNALAAKGQNINLLALAASLSKDRLSKYKIYYRSGHWIKNGIEFKFILERDGELTILLQSKLSDVIREILKIDF